MAMEKINNSNNILKNKLKKTYMYVHGNQNRCRELKIIHL